MTVAHVYTVAFQGIEAREIRQGLQRLKRTAFQAPCINFTPHQTRVQVAATSRNNRSKLRL